MATSALWIKLVKLDGLSSSAAVTGSASTVAARLARATVNHCLEVLIAAALKCRRYGIRGCRGETSAVARRCGDVACKLVPTPEAGSVGLVPFETALILIAPPCIDPG